MSRSTRPRHQHPAQRPQPGLVVRERASQKLIACRVADAHVMLLRRPVDAGAIAHLDPPVVIIFDNCPGQEVPLRTLIDRPSAGLRLLPAGGPPPRRGELVSVGPSNGASRKWLSLGGGRGSNTTEGGL